MRRHGQMRWRSCALLVATVAVLAGCASLKPAGGTAITDISLIAGEWAGTINPSYQPFYLKITADRKIAAAWGANYAWGTVTIQNGQATYEMQPARRSPSTTGGPPSTRRCTPELADCPEERS
jgi:hypothetical protein